MLSVLHRSRNPPGKRRFRLFLPFPLLPSIDAPDSAHYNQPMKPHPPQRERSLILASASPRRKQLLTEIGYRPIVLPAGIDESAFTVSKEGTQTPPRLLVQLLSAEKALAVDSALRRQRAAAARSEEPGKEPNRVSPSLPDASLPILAADTLVVYRNLLLGKPKDRNEAFRILKLLSGKTHRVITAFTLLFPNGKMLTRTTTSFVTFKKLSFSTIHRYLALDEWEDAAGGYKIQANGKALVARVWGNQSNVVGLPVNKVDRALKSFFSGQIPRPKA